MSWGTELWDQYDSLSHHTQRGIEFLDKYYSFLKERSSIESEYAYKLKKLVKNHQPKKKEEDDNQFSTSIAFVKMLKEIVDIAGQHEIISEAYSGSLMTEIIDLTRELKEERKKHLHEGQKNQNNLQTYICLLDKHKKSYEKSFKESEKANDTFVKIDADINLSRADVEKARMHAQQKNRTCEDNKTDYANQLQKTNELQRIHYNDLMPNMFQQLQDMEERRIACIQNVMKRTADAHKQVLPIIQTCLNGIIGAAESINPREDSLLVIEKYKSGYSPPDDIPFEDLSNPRNGDLSSNTLSSNKMDTLTVKGTLSGGKNKKRGKILNIFSNAKNSVDEMKEDCSDLPPNQRKKKLQQKIDELKDKIKKETQARDGLMKMKGVYEQNPSMGDPLSIEGQLADNGSKLEKLQNELQKFQGYMLEAEGHGSALSLSREHRSSLSEDSLSRSASDSSVCNPNGNVNYKLSAPGAFHQTHGPESGIGTSQPSITDGDADSFPDPDFENDYEYSEEFDAVLGTGKALYPFTGQSEGSIDVCEGEEFDIVELDQGDGWTRIRKRNFEEGFVPTSYIETYLYNSC
ncbi:formin-binding protein 1-like isoform X2 [Uloborus diversus]|uniref:formin-binding protein 1-like isoform X2 n=1 Tax=Uloborus diversus TaxID=327109 RepID=UPI00240A18A7|nr:formin-binding protein 1-like isoform X2 [Uloborus diversus]